MGNIFESRIIVNGPETEMARFKAQVGTVTPLGSREGYVPSPGEFAFRFDERAAPEYLYHHWVEGFPALTFDISVFRDDFDCLDYWTDANGKLVRGERWFAFRDGSRISAEEAQALDDRADAETSRFFDAIDQRPHNNPEIEATARNLDSYMRFRAEREDQRRQYMTEASAPATLALDPRTLEVIKSFSRINEGLAIQPGNVLTTVAPRGGTLSARVVVPVTFPVSWAVYDVKRFLAALATFERPKLTFVDGAQVEIRGVDAAEAGLVLHYPLCRPEFIYTPKEKKNVDPAFIFPMSRDRLKLFADLGGNLHLPHLVLTGDGTTVYLSAADAAKPDSVQVGGRMPVGTSTRTFRLVFAADDWRKVLWTSSIPTRDGKSFDAASYRVGVGIYGEGGIAHLVSEDEGKAQYFIGSRLVDDARFGGRKVK
jgi:hypothetical protein